MKVTAALSRTGYRTVFALAFIIAFEVHLLLFSLSPMVSVVMEEMNLTHAQFGVVFSVAMISLILFRLPWGLVADHRGYVGVLRLALVLSAAAAGMRGMSQSYAGLLASQFFVGFGLAAVMPCLSLMVKEWGRSRPALGTGIYFAGFAAGNASALAVTPQLLELMPWRQVFLVYAAVAGIICVAWFLLGRSRGGLFITAVKLGDLKLVLREKLVWVLLFMLVGSMGCYDTLASWMPRVLQMKQLNPELASVLPVGFFAAGPVMGLLLDRFRSRSTLIALLGVVTAASVALMVSNSVPLLVLCFFVAGFTTTGVSVASLAMPVEEERLSPYAGTVAGFITSVSNVGPLAVPVVFGYLIDVTGFYSASLFTVAALGLVLFVGCSRLLR